ncbi:MAG: DUF3710 domain-containing protein [Actinomycetota bacterium]
MSPLFRRSARDEPDAGPAHEQAAPPPEQQEQPEQPEEPTERTGKTARPDGPFDASEVDLDQARAERVDLGSLLVRRDEGLKLQLQVDEKKGVAPSVMVVMEDAAVQLVTVAAPRSSGLWEETRQQIADDARQRGGTAEEARGPFGTEVRVVLPTTTSEGKKAFQPSRIAGIDGPRWMLRATFLGKATSDADVFARLVRVVRDTVVIRGESPMPPGDVIPLRPPEQS